MRQLPGRLGMLLARDIMTSSVVVLEDQMLLEQAIQILRKVGHSGAPVINEKGVLVGTISIRDILGTKKNLEHAAAEAERVTASGTWMLWQQEIPESSYDQQQKVCDKMRKDIYKITQFSPMIEAARLICSHHLHRLPVIDASEKLVGLITPIDIIAAMVNTVDEQTDAK
jgi:CBS domain-containing protein